MKHRDLLKELGVHPSAKLSQNFLIDKNQQEKIVKYLELSEHDHVLEIGPGTGALTDHLALSGAQIVAVEYDSKLAAFLTEKYQNCPNVQIVHQDILKYQLESVPGKTSKHWKIIGNLPYAITSPILFHLLQVRDIILEAIVMMQKEVADRLIADPGGRDYGRLSASFGLFGQVERLVNVPPKCFYPEPNVESTVLRVLFRQTDLSALEERSFLKVVQAAFGQRRKKLINSLAASPMLIEKEKWLEMLFQAEVSPDTRAERLSSSDFLRLSRLV